MNGTTSTLKDEIKKSQDSKKKEKFKFIAAIVVTNLMVAILCLPSQEDKGIQKNLKILHPDHQIMVLPLQALVTSTNENDPETPVSLVSKDKKLIAAKAFLHEQIKVEGDVTQFKVEISNHDIVKVSQSTEQGVIAIPYVENKKISSLKRGSKYEVSL